MLLTIDIGNTNVTLGAYQGNNLCFTARLATDLRMTADQYAIALKDIVGLHGEDYRNIKNCIISSVVPIVGNAMECAVFLLCNIKPLTLSPGVKTGLNIKIDNPAQLGADLVAGAVGALGEYPLPCVIIDMGTASTISVLDKNGAFLGGVIAAGVKLTLKALATNTSQLPAININAPQSVIGTNTVDCMNSGLVYGTAAMIDGLLERIFGQLGEMATVVATGGLSKDIIKHCKCDIIYDETLLLKGLKKIYEKNN
ncbi:MAG: type III pantothenate kinase [Clostridia bacterium]|nr:type III pantothenate kinase [Clostridia bacterium]